MATNTQTNTDIVREFHTGIWAGEFDLFDEYVAADYVGHDPNVPGELHEPAEFRAFIAGVQAAMSDIDHTIADLFGEDDRVVVRGRLAARHTGEMIGIPRPRGRGGRDHHLPARRRHDR